MSRRVGFWLVAGASVALGLGVTAAWDDLMEKRVAVVSPGRLVRGAWQRPGPLRRIIMRERIKTIVTLTAINRDDPKHVNQERVVRETGVAWVIVPLHGSRATPVEMAEAADLLADPDRQPVFFHCVAGHHRTSLVHAAYRIRHQGWSAERAWREVASLPWARPRADLGDRRLIEAFAAAERSDKPARKDGDHATSPVAEMDRPIDLGAARPAPGVSRLEPGDGQLRDRRGRTSLPLGPDAGRPPGPDRS